MELPRRFSQPAPNPAATKARTSNSPIRWWSCAVERIPFEVSTRGSDSTLITLQIRVASAIVRMTNAHSGEEHRFRDRRRLNVICAGAGHKTHEDKRHTVAQPHVAKGDGSTGIRVPCRHTEHPDQEDGPPARGNQEQSKDACNRKTRERPAQYRARPKEAVLDHSTGTDRLRCIRSTDVIVVIVGEVGTGVNRDGGHKRHREQAGVELPLCKRHRRPDEHRRHRCRKGEGAHSPPPDPPPDGPRASSLGPRYQSRSRVPAFPRSRQFGLQGSARRSSQSRAMVASHPRTAVTSRPANITSMAKI